MARNIKLKHVDSPLHPGVFHDVRAAWRLKHILDQHQLIVDMLRKHRIRTLTQEVIEEGPWYEGEPPIDNEIEDLESILMDDRHEVDHLRRQLDVAHDLMIRMMTAQNWGRKFDSDDDDYQDWLKRWRYMHSPDYRWSLLND